jgi:hypothetical protein
LPNWPLAYSTIDHFFEERSTTSFRSSRYVASLAFEAMRVRVSLD